MEFHVQKPETSIKIGFLTILYLFRLSDVGAIKDFGQFSAFILTPLSWSKSLPEWESAQTIRAKWSTKSGQTSIFGVSWCLRPLWKFWTFWNCLTAPWLTAWADSRSSKTLFQMSILSTKVGQNGCQTPKWRSWIFLQNFWGTVALNVVEISTPYRATRPPVRGL